MRFFFYKLQFENFSFLDSTIFRFVRLNYKEQCRMRGNRYKSDKKYIYKYLKNGRNKKGKILFDQWFDSNTPAIQSAFSNDGLKKRIKRTIDDRTKSLNEPCFIISKKLNKNFNFQLVGIAASLIIVIGLGLFFYLGKTDIYKNDILQSAEVVVKQTSLGERSKITLADGTKVFLNSGSTLKFPKAFDGTTREVELTGEAFFEVKRIIKRPFIVHSGNLKTTVLGTSFNVQAYPEKELLQVAVATGKVKVEIKNQRDKKLQSAFLMPNQKVEVDRAKQYLITEQADIGEVIGWKNGFLIFKNLSIDEIADKLEKWYGISVQLANQDISDISFIGKFENPDLEEVLNAITFTTGIKYKIDNTQVLLYKSNSSK